MISMGRQWLILGFTVGKMLVAIGAVAHILACSWYALGGAVSDNSWLDIAGIKDASFQVQHSAFACRMPSFALPSCLMFLARSTGTVRNCAGKWDQGTSTRSSGFCLRLLHLRCIRLAVSNTWPLET